MRKKRLVILFLVLFFGVIYYSYVSDQNLQKVTITRVIDGDTVEISDGQKIRLIGINTPEKNEPFSVESKSFLEFLVKDNDVYLDSFGYDRYNRILGYLFVNGQNVNELILRNGLGHLYIYETDSYSNNLIESENYARSNKLGIWQESEYKNCIKLIEFTYLDITDNDNEILTLENKCGKQINVIIKDDATHIYHESIKSGLFSKTLKNIFNDDGDSLYIWDEKGKLINFHRYS